MSGEESLQARIEKSRDSSDVVETTLKTSERVLARVTDGIYRQPGSALRELIANAYDADATKVIVRTDRPRFLALSVDDDGLGMTPAALAHLLESIGGSAKRRPEGAGLGITAANDPTRSPGGRRLIGRIGIGLFSVSQLSQSFQITTKVAGDQYRTVATVALRQFGQEAGPGTEDDGDYEAGRVAIWREVARDVETQGTSILLDNIRPQTRRSLQSDSVWRLVETEERDSPADVVKSRPPRFHVGRVKGGGRGDVLRASYDSDGAQVDSVPWERDATPRDAFRSLVDCVWAAVGEGPGNPKLETLFDAYLQMVWQLSLSIPLPYVDGHPFHIPFRDRAYTYQLTASSVEAVNLTGEGTLSEACGLEEPSASDSGPFDVRVDNLQLSRPLRFTNLPTTGHALKRPIVLVGRCRETFPNVSTALTGGPLAFEAYLLWNPKIAPTEHQGSLIRVHGASGTLFDATFMQYQVSEQTRKQQISCEIFVSEGLEGAMNIDRESYNFAHPHIVFLTRWLHAALTRLATLQKRLAASMREAAREGRAAALDARLDDIALSSWVAATGDEDVIPPLVAIAGFEPAANRPLLEGEGDDRDRILLDRLRVMGTSASPDTAAGRQTQRQLEAVASVLLAYGVADLLDPLAFEDLIGAVRRVLETGSS